MLIFNEPMPPWRLAGFALVWLALTVFTWDGIRHLRSVNRPSLANATVVSGASAP